MVSTTIISSVPTNINLSCLEKIKEGTTSTIISDPEPIIDEGSIADESVLSPSLTLHTHTQLSSGEISHKSVSVATDPETPWKHVDSGKGATADDVVGTDAISVTVTEAAIICSTSTPVEQSSTPIDQTSPPIDRSSSTANETDRVRSVDMVQPPVGPRPSRYNERPNINLHRVLQVLFLASLTLTLC